MQTKSWVTTRGRITQCEWTISGETMWPTIKYNYKVGDTDYTGEYLFVDTVHNEPSSQYARHLAYRVAIAYQKHEDINVYYDPDDPHHAVLDTTVPRKLNVILLFIAGLILIHVIIMGARIFLN